MRTLPLVGLLIGLLTWCNPLNAQDMTIPAMNGAKHFTLDDLIPGGSNYYSLQPEKISITLWGEKVVTRSQDALTLGKRVLVEREALNELLKANDAQSLLYSLQGVTFPYGNKPIIHIYAGGEHMLVDFKEMRITFRQPLVREGENAEWMKHSHYVSYTIGNNLYVMLPDGSTQQVTDEPQGIVCGQVVHRNEFGIEKGTFWSPSQQLLAFYRMDERMVSDYPQTIFSTRIATINNEKYPMAGETSHEVTVGIYNPKTQQTVWLDTKATDNCYFTNISWAPDEKSLYIIELNRDQNHSQLVRYNASTGAREEVLIEETHPKYVEPEHPITFLPWNEEVFIYQSQMDGYNHLYLYNTKGQQLAQLTKGEWLVQNLVGFIPRKHEIVYQSTEVSPLTTTTWVVTEKGKRRMLGNTEGVHTVRLSEKGTILTDFYNSPHHPRCVEVIATSNGKRTTLLDAANPWEGYATPEISVGTLKAADGVTDLYYRLVKPVNFDPNKKYPAVVYVYGGPHAQMITGYRNYDARGWDIYMAQKGYVVFSVDNRGSSNRGRDFENCTFRHLGVEEMKDQMKGVEWLTSLPYVDKDRLGVHGWSFGGFMTINLMATYPDVFKVGVAGGPVIDWSYYEVMYGERYMDTPQSNPEGYANSNLKNKVKQLKGKLQVIIGGNDPTCVPQHTLSFMRQCIDDGFQPDLFIYPAQGHNMVGKDRVHLHQRITQYFEDYLK